MTPRTFLIYGREGVRKSDVPRACRRDRRNFRALVEKVGLVARDLSEERLELEPARHVASDLFARGDCGGVIDFYRRAGGFGEQLRLATAVHGDEPPRGFFDAVADGEQSVVAQDCGFALAESLRDALAFRRFANHSCEIRE
jgi:hypothetical protein